MKLSKFEPKKLFEFFEDITKIPRGSYNEKQIADYLCSFASKRSMRYVRDKVNNVIIYKNAHNCASKDSLILQGHTDMVCEKLPDIKHDFLTDPIELVVEDNWIRANGTTLGADNGVAVAMMLTLLDDESAVHPPLECVFTVCEETGLEGVMSLDTTLLSGRKLINLDDGPEFFAVASSAGSVRIDCTRTAETENMIGTAICVNIGGLSGGHSGTQINEEHANAIKIAARILRGLLNGCGAQLAEIKGGDMINAIPRNCFFKVVCYDEEAAMDMLGSYRVSILDEIHSTEPDAFIKISKESFSGSVLTPSCSQTFAALLDLAPNGVLTKDPNDHFTISSSNLGNVRIENNTLIAKFMPRSSVDSLLYDTMDRISLLCGLTGFEATYSDISPGWKYEDNSELREIMKRVAKEQFGRDFTIGKVHAGLECGVFTSRIPGMDAISIGPRTTHIHTPMERLDADSFSITYEFLKAVCENMANFPTD